MKWLPQDGSVQWSADQRYFCVQANSQDCIAYRKTSPATGQQLGKGKDFEEAREICEEYDMLSKRA